MEEKKELWKKWRWKIFALAFLSTLFHNITRKTLSYVMKDMMTEKGFTVRDMGFMASAFALSFSVAKVFGGVASDQFSPRILMFYSLFFAGLSNILFGYANSLYFFIAFWAINGFFQGTAWPPVARLLTVWYPQSERGSWWSLTSSATTVGNFFFEFVATSGRITAFVCVASVLIEICKGGAMIAIGGSLVTEYHGWRYTMWIPGFMCMGCSLLVYWSIRDSPSEVHLPPADGQPSTKDTIHKSQEKSSAGNIMKLVLTNFDLWLVAAVSFLHYVIRTAMSDWGVVLLVELRHFTALSAGTVLFWVEVVGTFGGLSAGFLSDKVFLGNRAAVNLIYLLGVFVSIVAFVYIQTNDYLINSVVICLLGFFLYGPQTLLGVQAAELVDKKATGTALGLVGASSGMGGFVAGYPLSLITATFGWNYSLLFLAACALAGSILLVPLLRTKPKKE